jgi:hypothetical protein
MRFWDRKLNNFKHLVYKDWDDETPQAVKIKDAIEKVEMANKELLEAILDNQHEVNQEMLNRFKRLGERSYANE